MNDLAFQESKMVFCLAMTQGISHRFYDVRQSLEAVVMDLEGWDEEKGEHKRRNGGLKTQCKPGPSEHHQGRGHKTEEVRPLREDDSGCLSSMRPPANITDTAAEKAKAQEDTEDRFHDG